MQAATGVEASHAECMRSRTVRAATRAVELCAHIEKYLAWSERYTGLDPEISRCR